MIKEAYKLGTEEALKKIAGVGWDLHTYSATPEEVAKARENLRNSTKDKSSDWFDAHEVFDKSTGHTRSKGTNYKLNDILAINHSPDLWEYTRDDAYSDTPTGRWLNKEEAAKALAMYEEAAKKDLDLISQPANSRTTTKQVQKYPALPFVSTGIGAASGLGTGALLRHLTKGKLGAKPAYIGGSGIGAMLGGGLSSLGPKKKIKEKVSQGKEYSPEEISSTKKYTDAFINNMRQALNNPKVKAIGLEYE